MVGKRLLSEAVADLGRADLGERVAEHRDDALGRRDVGGREPVAIVERLHGDHLALAHGVGGDVGFEQRCPRLEHLPHHAGLVAQTPQLERDLLKGLELGRKTFEALRALPLRVVQMGVVEGQRGELADRLDELDLLGRVGALLVVEELDHADDAIARLERHAELAGLAVLDQQAALVVVQRRVVEAQDRHRPAGLDDARRRAVVAERPEPADDVAKLETAAIVADDRAHGGKPGLEHVDVAGADVEQRHEALDDRLDHRARLQAGGEVEARLDDERQIALAGIELADQTGVFDGHGHVAADAPGKTHLLARERPGPFGAIEDHRPQAEIEGPQRHDEHALQLEIVQVRRRRQAAFGKPRGHVVDRQHFVGLESMSQDHERVVRVAQRARIEVRAELRLAAPLAVAYHEGQADVGFELAADAPHGALDELVRLPASARLADDLGFGLGEPGAGDRPAGHLVELAEQVGQHHEAAAGDDEQIEVDQMLGVGEDVLDGHHGGTQRDGHDAGHDDRRAAQREGDEGQRDDVEAAGDPLGRRAQVEGEHTGHEHRRDRHDDRAVALEPAHEMQQARVAGLDRELSDSLFGHGSASRRGLLGRAAGAPLKRPQARPSP